MEENILLQATKDGIYTYFDKFYSVFYLLFCFLMVGGWVFNQSPLEKLAFF